MCLLGIVFVGGCIVARWTLGKHLDFKGCSETFTAVSKVHGFLHFPLGLFGCFLSAFFWLSFLLGFGFLFYFKLILSSLPLHIHCHHIDGLPSLNGYLGLFLWVVCALCPIFVVSALPDSEGVFLAPCMIVKALSFSGGFH